MQLEVDTTTLGSLPVSAGALEELLSTCGALEIVQTLTVTASLTLTAAC